jgi:hypothetical protein
MQWPSGNRGAGILPAAIFISADQAIAPPLGGILICDPIAYFAIRQAGILPASLFLLHGYGLGDEHSLTLTG